MPLPLPARDVDLSFTTVGIVWWECYFSIVLRKGSRNFGQDAMPSAWDFVGKTEEPNFCLFTVV